MLFRSVVVTEAFTGNIALKTAEGTAKQIGSVLKDALTNSGIMSKVGALLAKKAFDQVKMKLDPRRTGGGVFLGLDGIVIKSHGGADPLAFSSAIDLGYEMVRHELQGRIRESLAQAQEAKLSIAATLAAPELLSAPAKSQ